MNLSHYLRGNPKIKINIYEHCHSPFYDDNYEYIQIDSDDDFEAVLRPKETLAEKWIRETCTEPPIWTQTNCINIAFTWIQYIKT